MVQLLVLVVFVTAVAFWWRYSVARKKKQHVAPVAQQNARKSYHCVEVRQGTPACKASQQFGHVRFLSDEAPRLPLLGCTEEKCTCGFIHHDDRREDDRRHPYGRLASIPPTITGERRSRTERRQSRESAFRPSIAR